MRNTTPFSHRLLSFVLAFVMVFSMVPAQAFAAETVEEPQADTAAETTAVVTTEAPEPSTEPTVSTSISETTEAEAAAPVETESALETTEATEASVETTAIEATESAFAVNLASDGPVAYAIINDVPCAFLSLNDFINFIAEYNYTGVTLTLNADIELGESYQTIKSGVFTLDLNGHEISSKCKKDHALSLSGSGSGVDVTIVDSGEGGKITGEYGGVRVYEGKLTVTGGSITGNTYEGVTALGSTVAVTGGTVTGSSCGVAAYQASTVTIAGGTISATGKYGNGMAAYGSTVTITGGEISGFQYDLLSHNSTVVLGVNEDGVGATFPDGITVNRTTLNAILDEGAAYWAGDTMLAAEDTATSITDKGDITIKTACVHEGTERKNYVNNGDDTTHTWTCGGCNNTVTEDHDISGCVCTLCDWNNHAFNENGFCTANGCYQPAELVDGVYQITNAGNLFWFAENVNSGAIGADSNAVLTADIDLENRSWTPIGSASKAYTGTFDGAGKTISNFSLNASGDNQGLFGYVKGTVKDFAIYGAITVVANAKGVGVVGELNKGGTVSGVISHVDITAGDELTDSCAYIAGITGALAGGTVSGCAYYGDINMKAIDVDQTAGIAGYVEFGNGGTVTNCGFYGTITTAYAGALSIGGIIGYSRSRSLVLTNCLSVGTITAESADAQTTLHTAFGVINATPKSISNLYYLSGSVANAYTNSGNYTYTPAAGIITAATADELSSGKIAYLLNGNQSNIVWKQTIGSDAYPTFEGEIVYQAKLCNGTDAGEYSNTDGIVKHVYANQICTLCAQVNPDAVATVSKNGIVVSAHTSLGAAISAVSSATADEKAVVTMLKDVDMGNSYQEITSGVFTIDLNSCEISGTDEIGLIALYSGVNVTITDSGEGGKIINYGDNAYGVYALKSTVTIEGGTISGSKCGVYANNSTVTITGGTIISVYGVMGCKMIVTGGTISGILYNEANWNTSITLGVNAETGVGATFTDGITIGGGKIVIVTDQWSSTQQIKDFTLNDVLAEGAAYWAGDTMVMVGDTAKSITDKGDITIKTACVHEGTEKTNYVNNGDDTHTWTCGGCNNTIAEAHAFTNGICVCGAIDPYAVATVSKNGTVVSAHTSLGAAISAVSSATAEEKAVVTLLADIALGDRYQEITSGVFTIDLNGCEISNTANGLGVLYLKGSGVNVTITDSGEDGKITASNIMTSGVHATNSTVTITGGTITGTGLGSSGVHATNSTVTITGGIVSSTDSSGGGVIASSGTLTITGGEISGNLSGITSMEGCSVVITGGTISSGVEVEECTLSITGGTITGSSYGVHLRQTIVNISGGTISATGVDGYGVYAAYDSTPNITGGIISGTKADLYVSEEFTIVLGVNANTGVGATFPGGITVENKTLNAILDEGAAYWAGETMVMVDDTAASITDKGDITIKTACGHTEGTQSYVNNGENHTYTWSCCNLEVTEAHAYTNGICACGAIDPNAVVTVSKNGTVVSAHTSLNDAITAVKNATAEEKAVVTLLADIDLGVSSQKIYSGVFTIDLNGCEISSTRERWGVLYLEKDVDVTIADSGKGGKITGHWGVEMHYGSKLTVTGGTISATGESCYGVFAYGDNTVTITGGEITSNHCGVYAESSTVTITGGTISATGESGCGVYVYNGELTVENSTISGISSGVEANKSTVTIKNSEISATGESGRSVYAYTSTVTITGGTISSTGESGYGVYAESSTVTITGGTVSVTGESGYGVYVYNGELTIENGTISGSYDGVYANMCTVTISGGTISATGEYGHGVYAYKSSTVTIKDSTISGRYNGVYVYDGELTIENGTISATGERGSGVYASSSTVTIEGSKISATGERGSGVYASSSTVTITGGEISGKYYDLYNSDAIAFVLGVNEDGVGATFPGGITVNYTTLNAVLAEGAAYWAGDTMLAPGSKLTSITDKGDITVKTACAHADGEKTCTDNENGTHDCKYSCCNLEVTEAHAYTNGICACGAIDPDAVVTVSKNGTVVSAHTSLNDAISAVSSATAEEKAVVTLLADIDLGDSSQKIYSGVFTIDLNGCEISSTHAGGGALYMSDSDVTIADSGEGGTVSVTGEYGYSVYAYTSTVTITGGTISSTGKSGYGMYGYTSTVTIEGGTVKGENGVFVYSNSTLAITGGVIKAEIHSIIEQGENNTVTISGEPVLRWGDRRAAICFDCNSEKIDLSGMTDPTGMVVLGYADAEASDFTLPEGYCFYGSDKQVAETLTAYDYYTIYEEGMDFVAPEVSIEKVERTDEATATVSFTTTEAGTYYYAIIEAGAETPSMPETGTECQAGTVTIDIADLADAQLRYVYIWVKDAAGNVSQVAHDTIPAYKQIATVTLYLKAVDKNGEEITGVMEAYLDNENGWVGTESMTDYNPPYELPLGENTLSYWSHEIVGFADFADNFVVTLTADKDGTLTVTSGNAKAEQVDDVWYIVVTLESLYTDVPENGWPIWVAGTVVTKENCKDILEDGTVSYDPETNTLTFQNAEIECDLAVLYTEMESLTVAIKGENSLTSENHEGFLFLQDKGSFEITGDGTLTLISDCEAFHLAGGKQKLTISGTAQIFVDPSNDEGIYFESKSGELIIKDQVQLYLGTEGDRLAEEGVYMDVENAASMTIQDKANVTIYTSDEEGIEFACDGKQTLTITGGTVYIEADEEAIDVWDVVISGGNVTAIGGNDGSDQGIYAYNLTITGGSVLASGTDDCGIEATDNLTITGGTVKVTSGGMLAYVSFTLGDGITIKEPEGGKIVKDEGYVVQNADGGLADEVLITDGKTAELELPERADVMLGGIGMRDGDYLAVGGRIVTTTKPTEGGYAYYKDGVLTLSNYTYSGEGYVFEEDDRTEAAALYVTKDMNLKLVLEGSNKLTCSNEDANVAAAAVVTSLTITGDGSLNAKGDMYGIMAYGDLTISGNGDVTTKGEIAGIGTAKNLTISGDGNVTGAGYYCGILSMKDMILSGNGTLTAAAEGYGIYSTNGNITIQSGSVIADSGEYGIYVNDLTISGGGVLASGEDVGIAVMNDLTITGGTVKVTSGGMGAKNTFTLGDGITVKEPEGGYVGYYNDTAYFVLSADGETANELLITDGVTPVPEKSVYTELWLGGVCMTDGDYLAVGDDDVTDTKPTEGGYAYYKDGVLTLNDYTYDGEGYAYDSDYAAALYASEGLDLELVLVGENSLICSNADCYASAVDAYGNLTISGDGNLKAVGDDYGIYAEKKLTISCNGDLTAEADYEYGYYGIYVYEGGLTISGDGNVTATSAEYGIYVEYDGLAISGNGSVTATGDYWDGIYVYEGGLTISGNVDVTAISDYCGIYVEEGELIISGGTVKAEADWSIAAYGGMTISGGSITGNGELYVCDELVMTGGELEVTSGGLWVDKCVDEAWIPGTVTLTNVKIVVPENGTAGEFEDGEDAYTTILDKDGKKADAFVIKCQYSGWTEIDGDWYYFDPETGAMATGVARATYPTDAINGIIYAPNQEDMAYAEKKGIEFLDATESWFWFDTDGKFLYENTGFVPDEEATRWAVNGQIPWHVGLVKDGNDYYYFLGDEEIGGNIMATGDIYVHRNTTDFDMVQGGVYTFDTDGKLCRYDGITDMANGTKRYYENARLMIGNGLTKVDDDYIYVRSNGELVVSATYWVPGNDLGIETGLYEFDENGFLVISDSTEKNGIYQEGDSWVYYEDGIKSCTTGLAEGTFLWTYEDGTTAEYEAVIYVRSNGHLAVGRYWITNTNGLMDAGFYEFDELGRQGSQKNGIVNEDGVLYYYVDGMKQYGTGLIELDGNYYYVRSNGVVASSTSYWVTNTNSTGVIAKLYVFDANGVLQNPEFQEAAGIVEENGVLYYYENGSKAYCRGVVKLSDETGEFYIYVRSNGQLATGIYWPTNTNGYELSGALDWGTDGRLYI